MAYTELRDGTSESFVSRLLAAGYAIDMTRVARVAWGATLKDPAYYELGSRVLYPNA
jgi:hypothetical protein